MNLENLQKAYDYIRDNVDEMDLDMNEYRYGDLSTHECNSVGCILGHTTILDHIENIPIYLDRDIYFSNWSKTFYDLDVDGPLWEFLFGYSWSNNNKINTKEQILARMKYVLDNNTYHPSFKVSDIVLNYSLII